MQSRARFNTICRDRQCKGEVCWGSHDELLHVDKGWNADGWIWYLRRRRIASRIGRTTEAPGRDFCDRAEPTPIGGGREGKLSAALLNNTLVALFAVVTLGLLLGRVQVLGLSLGSSGVIFTALFLGHLGYRIPEGVGILGLAVFVYCVGLRAGPSFFRGFARQGKDMARLAAVLIALAAGVTWVVATIAEIPVDLAAGMFAGCLTSTPGLAAALERLPPGSDAPVAYGIAYVVGLVGVVLFVQLLPRLLREDLERLSKSLADADQAGSQIARQLVEVANPAVVGRKLSDLRIISESNCQIPRILRGTRLVPITSDFTLEAGEHVLLVGREARLPVIVQLLGKPSERSDYIMDTERERRQIVVTSRRVVGKSLAELKLRTLFGVTVTRIHRHDLEFVPRPEDAIDYGDALSVVGEPERIDRLAEFAGHRARSYHETDLISLGIGITAGVVLGMIRVDLGGKGVSLGIAGGPLFVALILGHFGRIGPVVGRLPRAAHMFLMDAGLVLFLASAGAEAGRTLMPVLAQHGLKLAAAGILVTFLPLILGFVAARYIMRLSLLQIIGGVCGGMTSTPGLGIITDKTDSDIPVVSYAAAYPVALILVTVFAQVVVSVLT
ncbi:MAG: transporter [Acidobacteria bacterium]|nr:transporter [Acidobacteriota bacterium]